MIRLNALDCKLKNTVLSVRNLFRQSLEQSPLFLLVCPYCGAKGTCNKRGSYERSLVTFSDGKTEVIRLRIPRVQCPCGKSHALLPDLIVPYLSYSLPPDCLKTIPMASFPLSFFAQKMPGTILFSTKKSLTSKTE